MIKYETITTYKKVLNGTILRCYPIGYNIKSKTKYESIDFIVVKIGIYLNELAYKDKNDNLLLDFECTGSRKNFINKNLLPIWK